MKKHLTSIKNGEDEDRYMDQISRQSLLQVLNDTSVPVIIIDLEGTIVLWNLEAEKIFGWHAEDIIGKKLARFIISTEPRNFFDHGLKDHKHHSSRSLIDTMNDVSFFAKNKELTTQLKVYVLQDGGDHYFYVFARDTANPLSINEKLNEQKEFYQNILDTIPTDIAIFDEDHRYIYVNEHGIKNEELRKFIIGKDDFEYMRYRKKDASSAEVRREKFLEAKRTGQTVMWEDTTTDDKGMTNTSLRKYYPILDQKGKFQLMIGFGVDISERKLLEEYIKTVNHDLEEKIAKRTEELRKANEELNMFNSMVSHDLQAPLRSLSGFARILGSRYSAILDERGRELLSLIGTSAKHMGSLIQGLLKFSQLGKAPLTKVWVDMNALANTVCLDIQQHSGYPYTEIAILDMPPASCDQLLIEQVMHNLISNAVKYSSKKENPTIEIGANFANSEIVYYIKDNGAGFDAAYANLLFHIFQRLHSTNEYEGTGIGLAIVNRIITKHGGRIWAESKVGEGSTFYFTLGK